MVGTRIRNVQGFTLIELMIVVVLLAIIVSLAAPSFVDFAASRRVHGAAQEIYTDIQLARSESVQRNLPATVTFSASGYQVVVSGVQIRSVTLEGGNTLSFGSNSGAVFVFDPVRGTASSSSGPGYVDVSNSRITGSLRVVVNAMGRPQICVASGDLRGFASC